MAGNLVGTSFFARAQYICFNYWLRVKLQRQMKMREKMLSTHFKASKMGDSSHGENFVFFRNQFSIIYAYCHIHA